MSSYADSYSVGECGCMLFENNPVYGLVVERMNMELKGGIGLRPPSPPFSSSSSSLSSFAGSGSVLAFLLTGSKRARGKQLVI